MDQLLTMDSPTDIISNLCSIEIQPEKEFQHLSSLDGSKAAGIDAISPEVLKQCASSITPVVFHVLNLCISSCTLPNEWRTHLIVPIHKSGRKTDIKNYCPISLLCILSKLLERLIYDKIIDNLFHQCNLVSFEEDRHCNKCYFLSTLQLKLMNYLLP